MDFTIRNIQPQGNPFIAAIIRSVLEEFAANKPGTVYYDATTDELFELFQHQPNAAYFIAENKNEVLGGGGIFPTEGLPSDTCELVKMYLSPFARGQGIGKALIEKNITTAKELGYKKMYLETMPELKQALQRYEKFGFVYLPAPMGNSGHTGCDIWMMKELK